MDVKLQTFINNPGLTNSCLNKNAEIQPPAIEDTPEITQMTQEILDKVMMDAEEMKNLLYLFTGSNLMVIESNALQRSSFESVA